MSRLLFLLVALAIHVAPAAAFAAEGARLIAGGTAVSDVGGGVGISVALSQPVVWRAQVVSDPPRLVLDLRGLDPESPGLPELAAHPQLAGMRLVAAAGGWSRLEIALAAALELTSAEMRTASDGGAVVALRLDPVKDAPLRAPPAPAAPAAPRPEASPLTVVLDPGHGGLDPGAEAEGVSEAALMLTFARELDAVLASAGFRVVLTRAADAFVSLDARITRARAAGADVFVSLHADALSQGRATGARVYTLSDSASDAASAALAERHDRADLLAGVDLRGHDDRIASVLMDLARTQTAGRSDALADAIVAALRDEGLGLHPEPRLGAGFSVLRAPDIPSVLIELGFLSSSADRARLALPEWRAKAARAIASALTAWSAADRTRSTPLRP